MFLLYPKPSATRAYLDRQSKMDYSYTEIGSSRSKDDIPGYDNDYNAVKLGRGPAVFDAAREAVRQWKMFPPGWTAIEPAGTPIREGAVIAMLARVLGIWWMNGCRIVYTIDTDQAFGFAYGTLPGHVERGEELFLVEMDDSGDVWYRIRAFSRPRQFLVRLTYPLARVFQRKFVRASKAAMVAAVNSSNP